MYFLTILRFALDSKTLQYQLLVIRFKNKNNKNYFASLALKKAFINNISIILDTD